MIAHGSRLYLTPEEQRCAAQAAIPLKQYRTQPAGDGGSLLLVECLTGPEALRLKRQVETAVARFGKSNH